jgi:hypothetical protein
MELSGNPENLPYVTGEGLGEGLPPAGEDGGYGSNDMDDPEILPTDGAAQNDLAASETDFAAAEVVAVDTPDSPFVLTETERRNLETRPPILDDAAIARNLKISYQPETSRTVVPMNDHKALVVPSGTAATLLTSELTGCTATAAIGRLTDGTMFMYSGHFLNSKDYLLHDTYGRGLSAALLAQFIDEIGATGQAKGLVVVQAICEGFELPGYDSPLFISQPGGRAAEADAEALLRATDYRMPARGIVKPYAASAGNHHVLAAAVGEDGHSGIYFDGERIVAF